MTLQRRHLLTSAALALPAALLVYLVVNWLNARERVALLERTAQGHAVDVIRDACLQDPMWFLAGPRTARPSLAERDMPDADVRLPRPRADELPFEMFAYDGQYSPSSVAGPRFPDDFKRAMRSSPPAKQVSGEYASAEGIGLQTAIATGWGGPCQVLLFRQQPVPGRGARNAGVFVGLYVLFFAVALATTIPTERRVRALSQSARKSAANDYADFIKVSGSDEVGSMAALFNDTAADLRRRSVDARDREETLRRYVENTTTDVGEPLAGLEAHLGQMMAQRRDDDTVAAVKEAHRLVMQLRNQASVIRLRAVTDGSPRESVNLAAVIARIVGDRRTLADACSVTIDATKATAPVTVQADESLVEQAVANVIDNAIVYNNQGGSVRIELFAYEHGQRFKLVIADSGPGVSDEQYEGLTANKRFRGDESRTRRPGGRGLGLALAREVADRFGLQLDIRQPTTGGLEVEFATRTAV